MQRSESRERETTIGARRATPGMRRALGLHRHAELVRKGEIAIFESKKHPQEAPMTQATLAAPEADETQGAAPHMDRSAAFSTAVNMTEVPPEETLEADRTLAEKGAEKGAENEAENDPVVQTAIARAIAFGRKLRAQTLQAVGHPLAASQQLLQQNRQDPELETRLGQLGHELRTPLTSIRSFSEILVNHPDLSPRQRAHYLQIILDESERLEKVLEKQGA